MPRNIKKKKTVPNDERGQINRSTELKRKLFVIKAKKLINFRNDDIVFLVCSLYCT